MIDIYAQSSPRSASLERDSASPFHFQLQSSQIRCILFFKFLAFFARILLRVLTISTVVVSITTFSSIFLIAFTIHSRLLVSRYFIFLITFVTNKSVINLFILVFSTLKEFFFSCTRKSFNSSTISFPGKRSSTKSTEEVVKNVPCPRLYNSFP